LAQCAEYTETCSCAFVVSIHLDMGFCESAQPTNENSPPIYRWVGEVYEAAVRETDG